MSKSGNKKPSKVRIVGGEWKRRMVSFPAVDTLRPTPDAVRETLFNWLQQDLTGLVCLDLFAGSGVLGFEAASRGASHVTMVEKDAAAFAAIKENAVLLNGDNSNQRFELVRGDALQFASQLTSQRPSQLTSQPTPQSALKFAAQENVARYDLLFLDPPYRQGWIERLTPMLEGLLAPNARIYAEAEYAIENIGKWQCVRQGKSGQVYYHLFEATENIEG